MATTKIHKSVRPVPKSVDYVETLVSDSFLAVVISKMAVPGTIPTSLLVATPRV